ncbi:MAG: formimidoylglutamate deiminase [Proteobacteria bacterium]|jgi:formimidoylglutamate deiminase|nr:formimidoylglutamate deiminase [Pseudomonadota bacterium]
MTRIWADKVLTPSGWKKNITVTVGTDGLITNLDEGIHLPDHKVGCLLPAPVNVHSHSFQRAMAGLTERRGPNPNDTFWTWRKLMYQFLDQLNPEQVEAITAFVQMEMLEAGFSTNVEFHYLHHQTDGKHYNNIAEMSEKIMSAKNLSGIGLTLLPVLYQFGGCDNRPLGKGQIRFGNNFDNFSKIYDKVKLSSSSYSKDTNFGVAPHSLRAVHPRDLQKVAALSNGNPIHMHLAEQLAEVDEVKEALGARPAEWMLGNINLSSQWCLIHSTQMLQYEVVNLAKTGAVAGLCPITESSLGDGIFEGVRWLENKGKIAIGSDSNIRISLSEELRTLDYSQRLRDNSRAALADCSYSTGRKLFQEICTGGALAAGRKTGKISVGYWADLMSLDTTHIDLEFRNGDSLLDCFIFAGDDRMISNVWSAGRHMVEGGKHINREEITTLYRSAIKNLSEKL